MLCGSCGYNNSASARFCILCGSQLSKAEVMDPDPKICPGCGEPNEGHAMFCSSCGADVYTAPRRSSLANAQTPPVQGEEPDGEVETDSPEGPDPEQEVKTTADNPADMDPIAPWEAEPEPYPSPTQDLFEEPSRYEEPASSAPVYQEEAVEMKGEETKGEGNKRRFGFKLPLPKMSLPKLSIKISLNSRIIIKGLVHTAIVLVIASIGVSIGMLSIMVIKGR
ncbi:hypothetical protein TheveDRAFT_1299 [Thermanaerovibrio velox DSM 12556]|uniref:DZANK-type domain-containing protein n=1 Tax=Thermanaerovibrio velox DSM 12556 TaxID=926567 RepID=H0UNK4_9BACT|nr:zinc ribbon domain-containing protein [Thermanaerovibrio velox]EHM10419.1 hypothetical protein TheveDRAFT_1299 [Thermanaerovibrio velox DSM 12556]